MANEAFRVLIKEELFRICCHSFSILLDYYFFFVIVYYYRHLIFSNRKCLGELNAETLFIAW